MHDDGCLVINNGLYESVNILLKAHGYKGDYILRRVAGELNYLLLYET